MTPDPSKETASTQRRPPSEPPVGFDPALVRAFWKSTVMHQESLFFIEADTGDTTASLIFLPDHIVEFTSASGETQYEPGRDYILDEGSSRILRPIGSRIPATRREDLRKLWNIANGALHKRQAAMTYTHAPGLWHGFVPRFAGEQLPITTARLRHGEPLVICLAGDSIAEGHNSSGLMRLPPYQPPFGPLVAQALEHAHGAPIAFHNFGAEGWTTDHGLYIDDVVAPKPDLVLVAYGMNDLGHAEAHEFSANIQQIIAGLRRALPPVELVLVAPMLANPEWDYPVHSRSPEYRDALAKLCGSGIALADVTSLWTDLLRRKSHYDLTGNGLNHPNDFGHRLYAQVILELLDGSRSA